MIRPLIFHIRYSKFLIPVLLAVLAVGVFGPAGEVDAQVGCFFPATLNLTTDKQTAYIDEPINLTATIDATVSSCGSILPAEVVAEFYFDEITDQQINSLSKQTSDGKATFSGVSFKLEDFGYAVADSPAILYVNVRYRDPDPVSGGLKSVATSESISVTIVAGSIATDPIHTDGTSTTRDTGAALDTVSEAPDFLGGVMVSVINTILVAVIGVLRYIIYAIAAIIVLPILDLTLSIDASNTAATIVYGWTIVRDLVNMIFILILIILGFATILKLESYNYRKILVDLILMAILVNFSLVIARIIIQVADVVTFTFLPTSDAAGLNGVRQFVLDLFNQSSTAVSTGLSSSFTGALKGTATIIMRFIFDLMLVITFGAVAAYTLVRLVALWILMILSPFAFALRGLPATKGYADQWWSNFLKYAFVTPVIAFFLRIAMEMQRKSIDLIKATPYAPTSGFSGGGETREYIDSINAASSPQGFATLLTLIVTYVVILAFIWAGIIVANKLGIYGAAAITSIAQKGMKAPFVYPARGAWPGAKIAGGAAERLLARKAFQNARTAQQKGQTGRAMFWKAAAMLSPKTRKRAFEIYQKKEDRKSIDRAAALLADALYRVMPTQWRRKTAKEQAEELARGQKFISRLPFKGKETHEATIEERSYINEIASHHRKAALTAEDNAEMFAKALQSKDNVEIAAALQNLALGRNEDDYAALEGHGYTTEWFQKHLFDELKGAGFSPEQATYYTSITQELAEQDNKLRALGTTKTDRDGKKRMSADLGWYEEDDRQVINGKNYQTRFAESMDEASQSFASMAKKMRDNITKMKGLETDLRSATDKNGQAKNAAQVQEDTASAGLLAREISAAENRAQRYENYDAGFQRSKTSGGVEAGVRDALISLRIQQETNRRIQRMAPVQVAANLETALVREQNPDGSYGEISDFGALLMNSLPQPVVQSMVVRAFQSAPREIRMSGAGLDKSGAMIAPEQTNVTVDLDTRGVVTALNPTVAAIHSAKVFGDDIRTVAEEIAKGNFTSLRPRP